MALVRPTTTPLPDEIFDEWAPVLGEAELKALLYIVRRTLGFRKEADAISLTQFAHGITTRDGRVLDHGCGVTSRATLVRALRMLEEKGLIHATKGRSRAGDRAVTVYALCWEGEDTESGDACPRGGSEGEPPGAPQEPRWFAPDTSVVRNQNHRGSPRVPTTNRYPTDSQQDRETTRACARSIPAMDESADRDTAGFRTATAVWQAVVAEMRHMMTVENGMLWLAPAHALACDGHTLRVAVPSATHQHWLDRRLRRSVEAELRRQGQEGLCVIFEVQP